jgi:serine/threonine protein phosphatase PrpC
MMQFAGSTNPGAVRDHNEDCYAAEPDLGLWLVADGVGGHSHGEVASAIVRQSMTEGVSQGDSLIDAIRDSHQSVLNAIEGNESHDGMGSTVVALKIKDQHYELGWVGDSRAYLWDGKIKQISRDHNPVSEMLLHGAISQEEAARHPQRHVLSQSLGVTPDMPLQPGTVRGKFNKGQQILLCSDGLTDELPDMRIAQIMREHKSPQAQVDALIAAALAAGGHDNVTVVIVGEPPELSSEPGPQDTLDSMGAVTEPRPTTNHNAMFWVILAAMVVLALWFIF